MPKFWITLKHVATAKVELEAATLADAKRQVKDDLSGWFEKGVQIDRGITSITSVTELKSTSELIQMVRAHIARFEHSADPVHCDHLKFLKGQEADLQEQLNREQIDRGEPT